MILAYVAPCLGFWLLSVHLSKCSVVVSRISHGVTWIIFLNAHDWMVPYPLYMWATTSPSAGQHLPSKHGHWNVLVQSRMHGHSIARYTLKTIITVFTLSRKKKTWENSRGINERYFSMWMNIIVSCYTKIPWFTTPLMPSDAYYVVLGLDNGLPSFMQPSPSLSQG